MVNAFKVRGDVQKLVALGRTADNIRYTILDTDAVRKLSAGEKKNIEEIINDTIKEHKNYDNIQKVMNNTILRFLDSKEAKLYNERTKVVSEFEIDAMKSVMDPKVLRERIKVCYSGYNPFTTDKYFMNGENETFNLYQAPAWKLLPLECRQELPPIYAEFFSVMVNKDEASATYVVKWLAHSLRSRNRCTLTAIGNQGVGKGVLGNILKALHGDANYRHVEGSQLKKNFNGYLEYKTAVYFDEINFKDKDIDNRFKMLINDTVEIEKKGVDSKSRFNHASVYVSSNDFDSIRLSAQDRRFSVINLRNDLLQNEPGWEDIDTKVTELLEPTNIKMLADYLMNLDYDKKEMERVFVSKRYDEIRSESLLDWEDWFLNVYCAEHAGKDIELPEVKTAINLGVNSNLKLTSKTFEILIKKIEPLLKGATVFSLVRVREPDGTRPLYVRIEPKDKQPTDYLKNVTIKDE